MFRYKFVVKKNVFFTSAVVLTVSHENDVLILSCLSAPLLSGFVFSHLWSFNFKLRLYFSSYLLLICKSLKWHFLLSVKSLFSKESIASRLLNKVKPCYAGLFLGCVTRLEYPLLLWIFFAPSMGLNQWWQVS